MLTWMDRSRDIRQEYPRLGPCGLSGVLLYQTLSQPEGLQLHLYGDLTAVVAAGTADGVVDVPGTAVGTACQCGGLGYVVSPTLPRPGVGLTSLRMCHDLYLSYL